MFYRGARGLSYQGGFPFVEAVVPAALPLFGSSVYLSAYHRLWGPEAPVRVPPSKGKLLHASLPQGRSPRFVRKPVGGGCFEWGGSLSFVCA